MKDIIRFIAAFILFLGLVTIPYISVPAIILIYLFYSFEPFDKSSDRKRKRTKHKPFFNKRSRQYVNYYKYIKSNEWRKKANERLEFDQNTCQLCNASATEVHHKTYVNLGQKPINDLVSLCKKCHKHIHDSYVINGKHILYNPTGYYV